MYTSGCYTFILFFLSSTNDNKKKIVIETHESWKYYIAQPYNNVFFKEILYLYRKSVDRVTHNP